MAEPTLAERLVQHPWWSRDGFGWMPGMGFFDWVGDRDIVPLKRTARKQAVCRSMLSEVTDDGGRCLPDLEHFTVDGALLDQIRAMAALLWPHHWALRTVDYPSGTEVALTGYRELRAGRCATTVQDVHHMYRGSGAAGRMWLWAADRLVEQEAG